VGFLLAAVPRVGGHPLCGALHALFKGINQDQHFGHVRQELVAGFAATLRRARQAHGIAPGLGENR